MCNLKKNPFRAYLRQIFLVWFNFRTKININKEQEISVLNEHEKQNVSSKRLLWESRNLHFLNVHDKNNILNEHEKENFQKNVHEHIYIDIYIYTIYIHTHDSDKNNDTVK